jgi:predicted MFS family arabinose efflux permease
MMLRAAGGAIPAVTLIVLAGGMTVTTVWPALLTAKLFGQRNYSRIMSFIQAAAILGYGVGTPLYGLSFDRTGSYNTMLIAGMGLTAAAAVLFVVSVKLSAKLPRE